MDIWIYVYNIYTILYIYIIHNQTRQSTKKKGGKNNKMAKQNHLLDSIQILYKIRNTKDVEREREREREREGEIS